MIHLTARRRYVRLETSWGVLVTAAALVFATIVTAGSLAVTARSERDAAERRACAAHIEALRSRNAFLGARDVAEPCSYLRFVVGDQQ